MAGVAPDKVLYLAEAIRQRFRVWMAPIAMKAEAGVPKRFNLQPLLGVRPLRNFKTTSHPSERIATAGAARFQVLGGLWLGGDFVGPVATKASMGDPVYRRPAIGERRQRHSRTGGCAQLLLALAVWRTAHHVSLAEHPDGANVSWGRCHQLKRPPQRSVSARTPTAAYGGALSPRRIARVPPPRPPFWAPEAGGQTVDPGRPQDRDEGFGTASVGRALRMPRERQTGDRGYGERFPGLRATV